MDFGSCYINCYLNKGDASSSDLHNAKSKTNNDCEKISDSICSYKSIRQQFNCPYCGKCFVQNSHLQRHIRVHTGERPFMCNFCNMSFTQQGNLKVHIRIHTGDKPFKCSMCDYSTTESSNLKRHIKLRHCV